MPENGKTIRSFIVLDLITVAVGVFCLFADGFAAGKLSTVRKTRETLPGSEPDDVGEPDPLTEKED